MLRADINLIHIYTLHEPPLALSKHQIVPRHLPLHHPAIFAECPIFEPITALPLPAVRITELIPELDGDPVVREGKELFAKAILAFTLPLRGQEGDYLLMTLDEGGAIAPDAIFRVGFGDSLGISTLMATRISWIHWRIQYRLLTWCSRDPELSSPSGGQSLP